MLQLWETAGTCQEYCVERNNQLATSKPQGANSFDKWDEIYLHFVDKVNVSNPNSGRQRLVTIYREMGVSQSLKR